MPERRLHVLRISDVLRSTRHGLSRFVLDSGEALAALGHEVDYLFREDLATGRLGHGARRLALPWELPRAVQRLARAGRRFDLVEIQDPIAAAYCLTRNRRAGALPPVAVLSHGAEERFWRARRAHARRLGARVPAKSRLTVPPTLLSQSRYGFRHAQQAIVLNEADRDYLELELGVPPGRVSRVNTGVRESFFSIPRPPDRPPRRIIFIGTWIERKGIHELAEAWRAIATRRDLALTVIGSKAPENVVREDLGAGPGDDVLVAPPLTEDELQEEMGRADLYVMPSSNEGMPLATLEAAAAGLPCVVSEIPGHAEIFRQPDPESDGAILIRPHDTGALVKALERLTSDGDLARALGERARSRAREFTWGDTAKQLEAAYVRTLDQAASPP